MLFQTALPSAHRSAARAAQPSALKNSIRSTRCPLEFW